MDAVRPKVIIVGAGFGGLAAAQQLANKPVDVMLIDRQNHHLFQPLLYQVATAALSPADIAAPIRSILSYARNIQVLLDEATGIDPKARHVLLAHGGHLSYDWLVLATGARHSYFGHDHWARHAPGIKTIDDALDVRHRVLFALERAEAEGDRQRRKALLTFVVIGGGPTGVEMAGAIAELARRSVSRDFRNITPHCSRVMLVESGTRILSTFPMALAAKAEADLIRLGVEVRKGSPVSSIEPNQLTIGEEMIQAHTIVWAAGVRASPAAEWLDASQDKAGRIIVGSDLRVDGQDHIFAIGDTASAAGTDGQPLPGIAPVAKQQGHHVARQILGSDKLTFRYRHFGNLATIGRKRAIIDWNGWHLSGITAWLLWSAAHIWFLVGFRNRLTVTTQWLWSYLTYQRSARLITGPIRADHPPSSGREAA